MSLVTFNVKAQLTYQPDYWLGSMFGLLHYLTWLCAHGSMRNSSWEALTDITDGSGHR